MTKFLLSIRKLALAGLFLALAASIFGSPKNIYVAYYPAGNQDGKTKADPIRFDQTAIDSTSDGDTIVLLNDNYYLYYDSININKMITLKSENGWSKCTIDAGNIYNSNKVFFISS